MSHDKFQQDSLPRFSDIDPAAIPAMMKQAMDDNRERLKTLLNAQTAYTWANLLQPLEDMGDDLGKKWSPIAHLHGVMESEALRKAYNAVLPELTNYFTEVSQNEKLYQAVAAIAESPAFAQLDKAQRKIIENDLRDFKLAGIHLPADQKAHLAELEQTLSQLTTTFSEHLLDATNAWILAVTDKAKLDGLPAQAVQLAIENAKKRNMEGYVFTLDFPSYSTALKYLRKRDLRKTLYEAYVTRASDVGPTAGKWDNSTVMEDILKVRHEIAQLVGFPNYAAYSLATKMAKDPNDVMHFLIDLLEKSKPIAEREYQEVAVLAKKLDGIEKLEAWDLAYYSEKLCEQEFQFTEEDLRPYFPVDKALSGLFWLVNKLYGLRVEEQKGIDVWHADVKFFDVYDADGTLRAGFYIDLYARSLKRDGAWMDDCRVRRRLSDHSLQLPVAYLTCNFMPPVDNQPALLTHDDVLTLFHEFGHCLHHMLTKVEQASVSGINGVPWDAVEFPSQFMENFCWEKETLAHIAGHYQTGAPLPDDLYQKMLAAKHFQAGLQMVRQLEFSLFDFKLHAEYDPAKGKQVQAALDAVRKMATVVPIAPFNRFQHSFSHIFAGGYAAGYYSYKWAEVLSADAYAQFEENGIVDEATGQSFLKNILEVGGVVDPKEAFIAFRGREPKIDALLKQSGITS